MIIVNLKAYSQGENQNAINLVKNLETANTNPIDVVIAAQYQDLTTLSSFSKFKIWAQHIDPIESGAHTGWVTAGAVKDAGAQGTLLNHSEHKFDNFENLKVAHNLAKQASLKTLIFASNVDEFKKVIDLKPDFVSYEPPEFIGHTDISVATAKPEVISEVFEIAKNAQIPLIVGAGIHDKTDVKKCIELGAIGIAVATNIVKATDPKMALENLIEGFK